jgi:hypothetical protein
MALLGSTADFVIKKGTFRIFPGFGHLHTSETSGKKMAVVLDSRCHRAFFPHSHSPPPEIAMFPPYLDRRKHGYIVDFPIFPALANRGKKAI